MREKNIKGQVISGKYGEIKIRQKTGEELELGELLVGETESGKSILQVYDLKYASQISEQNLELISGMNLEEQTDMEFMDPHLRNYKIALAKSLVQINKDKIITPKSLPIFFSTVREVNENDLKFLTSPKDPISLGNLRSGTKTMNVIITLPGKEVFSHHILVTGTTGKGKSNLMYNLLWDATKRDYCAMLVLDPHDEYYGRTKTRLKDHPDKNKVVYYTSQNPPPGAKSLNIKLDNLKPEHFGFIGLTSAQNDALSVCYRKFKDKWIHKLMQDENLEGVQDVTRTVLKRKLSNILDIKSNDKEFFCEGIFDIQRGENTVSDIIQELEDGKTVIIDTSNFTGQTELLVGSIVTTKLFRKYKNYKKNGQISQKPVVSIVLEEAPRVLGKEILETGSNIFSTIAREGRKFKIGLCAITQMPSLIPREILANMNTKIILGTEMNTERKAIIDSAAQDLSNDDRNIASLDKGEAIITSNFARFAIPLTIPFFDEQVKKEMNKKKPNIQYAGVM